MKNYTIYCDLDGVLTDYDAKIKEFFPHYNANIPHDQMASMIRSIPDFWTSLKWKPDGKQLWDFIKNFKPIILSAILPGDIRSIEGKHQWVKDHLGNHVENKVVWRHMKKVFANPNAILIDDMISNIDDWRSNHGIGIHHTSTKETIDKLKAILKV